MQNLKIKLNSESEAEEVKRLAVKAGYTLDTLFSKWSAEFCYLMLCKDMSAGFADEIMADGDKPLSIGELRVMANPVKEYLVPQNAGGFMYKKAYESKCIPDSWIEIPEGAEIVTKGVGRANFWKNQDREFYFNSRGEWSNNLGETLNRYLERNPKVEIIWQRATHPEELPFIDDEPKYTDDEVKYMDENGQGRLQSINDQYAEIEQVRQVEIHGTVKAEPDFNFEAEDASGGTKEKGSTHSSAWDTQVGGYHYKQFKIQPMQFALENKLDAAQQNVIKYIMRHSFKNGKQDLEKAKHYIDLMIEFYYGDNNNG